MSSDKTNIDIDIKKILDTKKNLYEQVLSNLEKKLPSTQTIQTGGHKITNEIKIIGQIQLPIVTNHDKIIFRLGRLSIPSVMSISDAIKYAELI